MAFFTILERRGIAADWTTNNPVLQAGQWGAELDTGKAKLGDGETAWNVLPYFVNEVFIQTVIDASNIDITDLIAGKADQSALDALTDDDIAVVAPNTQTGTTYTFVLSDKSRLVIANNAAPQTYTIPLNSVVPFAIGTSIQLLQLGAGQVTWAITGGGILRVPRGNKTGVQYSLCQAVKVATDTWVVGGDVSA